MQITLLVVAGACLVTGALKAGPRPYWRPARIRAIPHDGAPSAARMKCDESAISCGTGPTRGSGQFSGMMIKVPLLAAPVSLTSPYYAVEAKTEDLRMGLSRPCKACGLCPTRHTAHICRNIYIFTASARQASAKNIKPPLFPCRCAPRRSPGLRAVTSDSVPPQPPHAQHATHDPGPVSPARGAHPEMLPRSSAH